MPTPRDSLGPAGLVCAAALLSLATACSKSADTTAADSGTSEAGAGDAFAIERSREVTAEVRDLASADALVVRDASSPDVKAQDAGRDLADSATAGKGDAADGLRTAVEPRDASPETRETGAESREAGAEKPATSAAVKDASPEARDTGSPAETPVDASDTRPAVEAAVEARDASPAVERAAEVRDASPADGARDTISPADARDQNPAVEAASSVSEAQATEAAPAAFDYYTDPTGSDVTGDGTLANPWRTIGHAAAAIDYARGPAVLHLGEGTFDESVVLADSITLAGRGADKTTIQTSASGDDGYVVTADSGRATVLGPVRVTLSKLRVHGLAGKNRGVLALSASLHLSDVEVTQAGVVSVTIGPNIEDFVIERSTLGSGGLLGSDYGIDVQNGSQGSIRSLFAGDHIDHVINIGLGCTVDISDSQLVGSPIYYADGIRIQGASNVTLRNVGIVRPAGGEPADTGTTHDPPYAGLEVAASSNGNTLVRVESTTITGFDVGIGVNLLWNGLSVATSTIRDNLTANLRTFWTGTSTEQYPVVDLGGGALGSAGGNYFGTNPTLAVDVGGPYDISARDDLWAVGDVESRLHDQLDDPALGRVIH